MEVRTTCPYCGVGCGVLAQATGPEHAAIAGDPAHPANRGRLCVKGTALGETLSLDGRLLHPEIDGVRGTWDAALDRVATGRAATIAAHGPDSVALYVSGQLLTEDYYAANKPAKGFLGTANIDSNTAWCHPVLHQRIVAAQAVRPQMRVVVVDPRRTATCEGADLHLPLRPGTDVALFAGLLRHLHEGGFANPGYAVHLDDVADAVATGGTVAETAAACGLPTAAVAMFFDWFARTKRVTTMFSQGVNQSSSGVDKVNAILNVHLLTGRIGKPLLSIHPDDAAGLADGGLAQVDSARGGGMLRVRQDRGQRRGTVFAPMHRT